VAEEEASECLKVDLECLGFLCYKYILDNLSYGGRRLVNTSRIYLRKGAELVDLMLLLIEAGVLSLFSKAETAAKQTHFVGGKRHKKTGTSSRGPFKIFKMYIACLGIGFFPVSTKTGIW
jgi:hypothetical protein